MKKESILAIIIAALVAFMYISGLPSALVVNISFADVDPVCITLLINIAFAMFVGIALTKAFIPRFEVGFHSNQLVPGIKKYGISCMIATAVPCIAFCIGLFPFDYSPTIWKVIIEYVVYYLGVGIIEEFFCRGLLQNALEQMLYKAKHPQITAVTITAIVFGLGHVFGMIGMPLLFAVCKVAWAMGLGIYLGAIYIKTRNLWVVGLFHFVIDLCGLPFCFSTQKTYPTISAVMVLCTFAAFGVYGYILLKHLDKKN